LQLEALTGDVGLDREIPTSEASSPGLVLAGYTKRFAAHRLHILGETEVTYLASLDATARRPALETLFQFDLPCIVISKGQYAPVQRRTDRTRARRVRALHGDPRRGADRNPRAVRHACRGPAEADRGRRAAPGLAGDARIGPDRDRRPDASGARGHSAPRHGT